VRCKNLRAEIVESGRPLESRKLQAFQGATNFQPGAPKEFFNRIDPKPSVGNGRNRDGKHSLSGGLFGANTSTILATACRCLPGTEDLYS
jgi:hypothetical protein